MPAARDSCSQSAIWREGNHKNIPVFLAWENNSGIGLTSSAKLTTNSFTALMILKFFGGHFSVGKNLTLIFNIILRKTNSWRLKLGEIHTNEMLKLQLVNSGGIPFVPLQSSREHS